MSGRNTKRSTKAKAKNPSFKSEVADAANNNERAREEWMESLRKNWKETCLKNIVEHAPADMIPCLDIAYVADEVYDNPTTPELWHSRDAWAQIQLAKEGSLITEFKRVVTYIQEQEQKGSFDKKSCAFRQFVQDFIDRASGMIPKKNREFLAFILGPDILG